MASGESSNKALVPIIAIGAALVLGAGAYFMMGGEEPVEESPVQAVPQPVNEPAVTNTPAPAPVATRTREPADASERTTARSRGSAPTEDPNAAAKQRTQRKPNSPTSGNKKKDEPKLPASTFRG
jgi:hypothetical protein